MSNANQLTVEFKLRWIDSVGQEKFKTLASIGLLIDGGPVWPISGEDTNEFHWFADELLAHLTECWRPLVLRQTYPISVQPSRPSFLIAESEKRWLSMASSGVESEQQAVASFADVHNLTNAFGGVSGLLPLWFLRDQYEMIIDTGERYFRVPIQTAIDAMSHVGDIISDRLLQADKLKWSKLAKAWKHRAEGDKTTLLALTIGADRETAATLLKEHVLDAPVSFAEASNDNDELRIAARMAGPIPLYQIKSVIDKVRTCHLRPTPQLAEARSAALAYLESQDLKSARPHFQGSAVAKWLRRELDLSDHQRVDPFVILEKQYNVDVRALDFGMPYLEAIAVWGAKFGPAVLLNQTSKRVGLSTNFWRNGVARTTAAHELCHLLLDAAHSLSAVDILDGRMPIRIEQRAKAFAAEFLLPSEEAASVWKANAHPIDLEGLKKIIKLLCRKYNVSESVAAWQLQHGAVAYGDEPIVKVLDQLVPQR
jgi:IrrE N-terminal-like domain